MSSPLSFDEPDVDELRGEHLDVAALKADVQSTSTCIQRAIRHQTRMLLIALSVINLVSMGIALAGTRLIGA